MLDLAEILPAQTEQRRAVEFSISPDVVIRVRMERLPLFVAPFFFRLILAFQIDRARIPVGLLAGNVVAAFQDENALSGRCERMHERSTARARPDDDYVVVFVGAHRISLAFTEFPSLVSFKLVSFPCTGNEKCTAGYSRDETWRSTRTARNRRERKALRPSAWRAAEPRNRSKVRETYAPETPSQVSGPDSCSSPRTALR